MGDEGPRDWGDPRQPPSLGHIPALDGLRGAAVLCVIVYHFTLALRPGDSIGGALVRVGHVGWIGVDLFFVLSGFLITAVLLGRRHGDRLFRNFYMRRTLRIAPLYYLVLIPLLIVLPLTRTLTSAGRDLPDVQGWLWTYTTNVGMVSEGSVRFQPLVHLWSLAVEEHFYLVWPLLVWGLGVRTLALTCLALVVGAVSLRCALIALQVDPIAAYVLTPCRVDGLAMGGLLALAWYRREAWERVRRVAPIVLLVGGALLVAITVGRGQFHHEDPVVQSAGYTVLAISFAALIALVVGPSANPTLAKLGTWGWLRTTGKYSYAMYLLHPLLIASPINHLVYGRLMPDGTATAAAAVAWVLFGLVEAFLAGWVSWHCWEKYFLSLKRYFAEAPRRPVAQGVAVGHAAGSAS